MGGKQFLRCSLRDTVRKREFEVFREELFDVGALDVVGLFDFDDSQNLEWLV